MALLESRLGGWFEGMVIRDCIRATRVEEVVTRELAGHIEESPCSIVIRDESTVVEEQVLVRGETEETCACSCTYNLSTRKDG